MGEVVEGVFCFEGLSLDPRQRSLRLHDQAVELRPRSFDVLVCLVRGAGRLVTKQEVMDAVWPDVVVTDESLTRCVSDIRQAIGDSEQRIIKTVPRRGYLFAAAVLHAGATPADTAAVVPEDGPPVPRVRRGQGAMAALVLVLVVAGALWVARQPFDGKAVSGTPPLSIVVLPLVSLNGDPDQAYFAEGLTEDLTTDLSRIPGSFVIARSSADSYRGKPVEVRELGRELGVRYVLEGSVQRLNDQVRLNARLVDSKSGKEIWADRFDGSRSDLVALQQTLTGTIARTLHLELMQAESTRSRLVHPLDPDAQDLTWQAWSLYERKTAPSVAAARELLLRAVALDPQSALAWSLLSDTYTADLLSRWLHFRDSSRDEWLKRGEDAAQKAYAADPENLYAVGSWATVLQLRGKSEKALAMFDKQVALNRNYAPAWHRISYGYLTLGQPEAALAAGHEALRLSPRDGRLHSFYAVMAAACLHAGRDEQALDWAQKSVNARPDFGTAYAWVAASTALIGDLPKARAALAEFRRLQPGYTISSFRAEGISDNPAFLAQHERFFEGLRKAGLPESG